MTTKNGSKYDYVDYFNDWFAEIEIEWKWWGFIDTNWKEICEIKYHDVSDFLYWFAEAEVNSKKLKINTEWEEFNI